MNSRSLVSAFQVGILAVALLGTARADDGWGPALGQEASPEGWVQVRDDDGWRNGGGWTKTPTPTPSPRNDRRRPVSPGPAPSAPPTVSVTPQPAPTGSKSYGQPPVQTPPIWNPPADQDDQVPIVKPPLGQNAPDVEPLPLPPVSDSDQDPNPYPLPPGNDRANPRPLPPDIDTGVPAPKPPLAYDHLPSWSVSGGDTPAVQPTVPRSEPASPAEYLLALLDPRRAEPSLLNLVLPRYSYFQGFVYAAGGAVVAGPVRVLGAVFAAGAGRTSWLIDGAMLTTTPDYLRGPGAAVRSRLEVVEWRDVEVGK